MVCFEAGQREHLLTWRLPSWRGYGIASRGGRMTYDAWRVFPALGSAWRCTGLMVGGLAIYRDLKKDAYLFFFDVAAIRCGVISAILAR